MCLPTTSFNAAWMIAAEGMSHVFPSEDWAAAYKQAINDNPKYKEAEGALVGDFSRLHADVYGNREFLNYLRNQGKFFCAEEGRELDLVLIDYADLKTGQVGEFKLPPDKAAMDSLSSEQAKMYETFIPPDFNTPFAWAQAPRRMGAESGSASGRTARSTGSWCGNWSSGATEWSRRNVLSSADHESPPPGERAGGHCRLVSLALAAALSSSSTTTIPSPTTWCSRSSASAARSRAWCATTASIPRRCSPRSRRRS